MKAVLWGYADSDMRSSWHRQMQWLARALQARGFEVKRKDLSCRGLEDLPAYDPRTDNPCDVAVYNHCDLSDLAGSKVVAAKHNWFFKPTVPDRYRTTLDPVGYGPYSSITYHRPPFDRIPAREVEAFFASDVQRWKDHRSTKWGEGYFQSTPIEHHDHWLVLGQDWRDTVNTRHAFGGHLHQLEAVVGELARLDRTRDIVVKMHPNTTHDRDTQRSIAWMRTLGPNVHIYSGARMVHEFIENCRAVLLANSGAGFDAMMHRKPIIAWGCPEYHWVAYDLRHLANLARALGLDWFDPAKQDRFLCWYMTRYCYYDQASAHRRVGELLGERIRGRGFWGRGFRGLRALAGGG